MSDQQFHLRVNKGPEPGKVYQLTSVSITIGRDPMADITINDPEVSRQHARLIGTMSGYRVQDLGSTNGTFIEGVRLGGEPAELQQGQIITIGSSVALAFQAQVDEEDQLATVVDRALLPPKPPELEQEEIGDMPASESVPEEPQPPSLLEPDDEEIELVDNGSTDEADSDQPAFAETPPQFTEWEQPLHEEPATVSDAKPEYSQSKIAAEPVVIPHQGDPPQPPTPGSRSNNRRPSTIIATLLLLVLCCCCSFVLFVYYYGGDWLLRQMELLP